MFIKIKQSHDCPNIKCKTFHSRTKKCCMSRRDACFIKWRSKSSRKLPLKIFVNVLHCLLNYHCIVCLSNNIIMSLWFLSLVFIFKSSTWVSLTVHCTVMIALLCSLTPTPSTPKVQSNKVPLLHHLCILFYFIFCLLFLVVIQFLLSSRHTHNTVVLLRITK